MLTSHWYDSPFGAATGSLAAVVTILAGVGAFVRWVKSRMPQRRVYYKVTTEPYDIADLRQFGMELSHNGRPLGEAWRATVRVWNAGSEPIVAGDFVSPFTFSVGSHSQLLAAVVADSEPTALRESLVFAPCSARAVTMLPSLLNPSDRFDVRLLAIGDAPTVSLTARVRGVTDIRRRPVYPQDVHQPGDRFLGLMLASYAASIWPEGLRAAAHLFGYEMYTSAVIISTLVFMRMAYGLPVVARRKSIFDRARKNGDLVRD